MRSSRPVCKAIRDRNSTLTRLIRNANHKSLLLWNISRSKISKRKRVSSRTLHLLREKMLKKSWSSTPMFKVIRMFVAKLNRRLKVLTCHLSDPLTPSIYSTCNRDPRPHSNNKYHRRPMLMLSGRCLMISRVRDRTWNIKPLKKLTPHSCCNNQLVRMLRNSHRLDWFSRNSSSFKIQPILRD